MHCNRLAQGYSSHPIPFRSSVWIGVGRRRSPEHRHGALFWIALMLLATSYKDPASLAEVRRSGLLQDRASGFEDVGFLAHHPTP